jgi:hypothetical protein
LTNAGTAFAHSFRLNTETTDSYRGFAAQLGNYVFVAGAPTKTGAGVAFSGRIGAAYARDIAKKTGVAGALTRTDTRLPLLSRAGTDTSDEGGAVES